MFLLVRSCIETSRFQPEDLEFYVVYIYIVQNYKIYFAFVEKTSNSFMTSIPTMRSEVSFKVGTKFTGAVLKDNRATEGVFVVFGFHPAPIDQKSSTRDSTKEQ